ncbi:MAG: septum formation initiator family protein [Oscillospiraceae bacterium]
MARMRAGTSQKKRSITGIVLRVAVVIASVYLLFSFVSGQIQVNAKQRELDAVQAKVAAQAETNQVLQQMMDTGDQDSYVERVAREKLKLAKPEERVFVDTTKQ